MGLVAPVPQAGEGGRGSGRHVGVSGCAPASSICPFAGSDQRAGSIDGDAHAGTTRGDRHLCATNGDRLVDFARHHQFARATNGEQHVSGSQPDHYIRTRSSAQRAGSANSDRYHWAADCDQHAGSANGDRHDCAAVSDQRAAHADRNQYRRATDCDQFADTTVPGNHSPATDRDRYTNGNRHAGSTNGDRHTYAATRHTGTEQDEATDQHSDCANANAAADQSTTADGSPCPANRHPHTNGNCHGHVCANRNTAPREDQTANFHTAAQPNGTSHGGCGVHA